MSSLPDVDMYLHRLFAGSEGSFHEHCITCTSNGYRFQKRLKWGLIAMLSMVPPSFFFFFCRELSILRMRNILLSQTNRWVVKRDAARSALWYRGVNWLRAIESLRRRRSSSTTRVVCSARSVRGSTNAGSLLVETAEGDCLHRWGKIPTLWRDIDDNSY